MDAAGADSLAESLGGTHWDVVVSGLGPVGTTLCGLLGKYGVHTLGVEREKTIYTLPRAGHVDHTSLRTLDELGVLDEMIAEMIPNRGIKLLSADGRVLARIPVVSRTPSGLPASLHFHQPTFDRLLRAGVERMDGIRLHNSVKLVTFQPDGEVQRLTLDHEGRSLQVSTRFLVGCDGASSLTRSLAGLDFQDYGFAESWVVIDLILYEFPNTLDRDTTFVADPRRPYAMIELPGMRYRFEFMLLPGETPESVTSDDAVHGLVANWLSRKQIRKIERAIVYTFRGARAVRWRNGGVAVAGDAAHLTPPFLGQGLCSGIRDVANLAWKLAYVVDGRLPESILHTYGSERSPHIDNVITTSIAVAKELCMLDEGEAHARNERLLGGGVPEEARIRFKLGELRPGPLVMSSGGMYMINPETGWGPLDRVIGTSFLVLAVATEHFGNSLAWWQAIGTKFHVLSDFPKAQAELAAWLKRLGGDVIVVRPDKYVLGCARSLDEISDHVRGQLIAPMAA